MAAFVSLAVQIRGLVGSHGILPVADWLAALSKEFGPDAVLEVPTLFWIDASDDLLVAVCYMGTGAALALLAGFRSPAILALAYVCYLSLVNGGQDFTRFQWDALLLESGFLALFLKCRSGWVVLLYRLLIARFMLMGGVVKLASGDPSWWNLTALSYHYETQPLPSPLAYHAHFLPAGFHSACVLAVFAIELLGPVLVTLSRPLRHLAAASFVSLQAGIVLTGNFGFFNLLTILLCCFLFDDRDLAKLLPRKARAPFQPAAAPTLLGSGIAAAWASIVGLTLLGHLSAGLTHGAPPSGLRPMIRAASSFSLVNAYGPFAVMTKERRELIVEGSADGTTWREYGFKYKPDAVTKALSWNIPHQPRLDWQMWFGALPSPLARPTRWLDNLLDRLQTGSPPVLDLLANNPFPEHPPRYLRVRHYRYEFADHEQRARTGRIWNRQPLDRSEMPSPESHW